MPDGYPFSSFRPVSWAVPIARFLQLPIPQQIDGEIKLDLGAQTHLPSLQVMPSLTATQSLLQDLLTQWSEGYRSVSFTFLNDDGTRCRRRFPLWTLKFWQERQEVREGQRVWQGAIHFVEAQVGTKPEVGHPHVNPEYCLHKLKELGWISPLFGTTYYFDFDMLSVAKALQPTSWFEHSIIFSGLLNLRAMYCTEERNICLMDSDLHAEIVKTFGSDTGACLSARLANTALWLREDRSRCIAAIVHVEEDMHWAALRIKGDGNICVADSLSQGAIPDWWLMARECWQRFFLHVDDNVDIHTTVPADGQQNDHYSCGPASLMAIESFVGVNKTMWSATRPDMGRLAVVMNITKCQVSLR